MSVPFGNETSVATPSGSGFTTGLGGLLGGAVVGGGALVVEGGGAAAGGDGGGLPLLMAAAKIKPRIIPRTASTAKPNST